MRTNMHIRRYNVPRQGLWLLMVAATTLLGSCSTDGWWDSITGNDDRVELYCGVRLQSVDTTRGNNTDDSGVMNTITSSNDKYKLGIVRIDSVDGVWDNYANRDVLEATMGNPDASNGYLREVEFTGITQRFGSSSGISYVGWYPQSEANQVDANDEGTSVTIPIDGKSDIMLSQPTKGTITGGFEVMNMSHLLCQYNIYAYRMDLPSDIEVATWDWGKLLDVEAQQVQPSLTVALPDQVSYATEGLKNISLADTDGIFFNVEPGSSGIDIPTGFATKISVGRFLAPPPIDGLLHLGVTTERTEAEGLEKSVSIARGFRPGFAYDIVLCFSSHGVINAEVSISDWADGHPDGYVDDYIHIDTEAQTFVNLSRYGTANCYTISSANTYYCFLGNVKGNGNRTLGETVLSSGDVRLNPGYIDVLWESSEGLVDMLQEEYGTSLDPNGYCYFFVPGKVATDGDGNTLTDHNGNVVYDMTEHTLMREGSAIIAAYDQQGGNIVWTWHIWITDTPHVEGYNNGFVALDRNLGATSADHTSGGTECYGHYYQWGRKDPMIYAAGGTSFMDNALMTADADAMNFTTSTEVVDLPTATRNPMTFYGVGSDYWCEVMASTSPVRNSFWGYIDDDEEFVKTIYDPCPPGYRVPEMVAWKGSGFTTSDATYNGLFTIGYMNVWYPPSGYVDNAAPTGVSDYGTTSYSLCCDTVSPTDDNLLFFTYGNGSWGVKAGNYLGGTPYTKSDAFTVRCVSENTPEVVVDLSGAQSANSYIISEEGYYKFDVTICGNGIGSITNDQGNLVELHDGYGTEISPARVDLLWWQGALDGHYNTSGNDCPVQVTSTTDFRDGTDVVIKVNTVNDGGQMVFVEGNAVLAAFDDADNILWTWHLWLTDEPRLVAYGSTNGYTLMDRNLGATCGPTTADEIPANLTTTYGFYYQWGRKDPFPTDAAWWYKDPATGEWSEKSGLDAVMDYTEVTSAAITHQNPTTFSRYTGTFNFTNDSSDVTAYWRNEWESAAANKFKHFWGYGAATQDSGNTISKTMYDPCPPGYRVCQHQVMYSAGLVNSAEGCYNLGNGSLLAGNQGITTGAFYPASTVLSDGAWMPFSGYRYATTGALTNKGTAGHIYTCVPHNGGKNGRAFHFVYSSATQNVAYQNRDAQAAGRNIRCQKE